MSDPTKIYLNPVEKDQIKQNTAVRQLIECASDDRTTINNLPTLPIFVPPFSVVNFYVDPAGNDANDGLTIGTPKQTILNATLTVLDGYFAPNSTAVINLANGTYNVSALDGTGAYLGTPMNWAEIAFLGNLASPSSVIIDGHLTTNGQAFYISQNSAGVTCAVGGVQIQNFGGGTGRGFNCQSVTGTFKPQNIIFAGGIDLCFGIEGGFVEVEGPLTFSGTNGIGVYLNGSITMVDFNNENITFGAGAAFTDVYLNIDNGATMAHSVGTITGTVTGGQFQIGYGGLLRAVHAGVDKNPSDIPGTPGTGQIFGGWFNNSLTLGVVTTQAVFYSPAVSVTALTSTVPGVTGFATNASSTATWATTVSTGTVTRPVFFDGSDWRFG